MATDTLLDQLTSKPDHEITLKDVINGLVNMRDSINNRLSSIEIRLNEIDTVKSEVNVLRDELEATKKQVAELVATEDTFPANLSVLIQNLPVQEQEDQDSLFQDVENLVKDGLELEGIIVQAVERIPPRSYAQAAATENADTNTEDIRPGIVKVKLGSLNQKISCLRNKRKLNSNPSYHGIYIRGCEDHATRLNRTNMETLLRELDMRKSFRFTGSGRMIKKEHADGNQAAENSGHGRGRGRGGGANRGRGARAGATNTHDSTRRNSDTTGGRGSRRGGR